MSKPDGKYKITLVKDGKNYYLSSQMFYPTDKNNNLPRLMVNEKKEEGQTWLLTKKCDAYSFEYEDDSYGLKGGKVLVDEEKENPFIIGKGLGSGIKLEAIEGKESFYFKDLLTGRYLSIDGDEKMRRDKYSMYLTTKEKPDTEWILEVA